MKSGDKMFVFQPETPWCKPHWVETTVESVFKEDTGELMFVAQDALTTTVGNDQQCWVEHSETDRGVSWCTEKPEHADEVQNTLFWKEFFD